MLRVRLGNLIYLGSGRGGDFSYMGRFAFMELRDMYFSVILCLLFDLGFSTIVLVPDTAYRLIDKERLIRASPTILH